jgi:site-specific DNA recombinase
MKKTSKPAPVADPACRQAVTYARVSSKEQEKEGFSIPAQLKLLKEYAVANGFAVAQEYVDVETAKQTGRAAFGEMVAYLKAHPSVRVMLVEKTDRLYRNLKDWVTVDELDVEMHFPKEGVVLSRESRSSEKFMHGIKVLMAKNYVEAAIVQARPPKDEIAERGYRMWVVYAVLRSAADRIDLTGLVEHAGVLEGPPTIFDLAEHQQIKAEISVDTKNKQLTMKLAGRSPLDS